MPSVATIEFPQGHKVKSVQVPTGLFIGGDYVDAKDGKTLCVRPSWLSPP